MRIIPEKYYPKLGYIEGWASVVINTALFVFKYQIGKALNSVSMVADAWHTLSDTLTSVVVISGFWISSRPADKEHPFGHGRAEVIGAVIIATLLAVVGFGFLKESVGRLLHHQAVHFNLFAICIFGLSVFVKEALAQFSYWAGRKINSNSLKADGWHHRSDAIASGIIVVGALAGKTLWWIDGIMGIGVSLLILYAAFDIMRDSSSNIFGETPEGNMEEKVRTLIARVAPEATHAHHIHAHKYGDHVEITMHIRLPEKMLLVNAHAIATNIEIAMRKELNMEATVHLETFAEEQKHISQTRIFTALKDRWNFR